MKRRERFARVVYDTRFDRFLDANNVDLDELAETIGTTRQNLGRPRAGTRSPGQETIVKLVLALRRLLNRPVAASDLFYLGEERDDDTTEASEFIKQYVRLKDGSS